MIRRFRAIIQTDKEPEDHEVIWKKGHKLLYWNNDWRPIYEFEASEIIYESKDGNVKLDVNLENETVWLTANQMALIFNRDEKVIRKHINNIFC